MIEIEDKETGFKCRIRAAVPTDHYEAAIEKRQRRALKQFMKTCKEARLDKAHNHRRP